ncbi:MAG: type II toxin-antitoxin system VapC family toxin [Candidatus Cybelea sp.]
MNFHEAKKSELYFSIVSVWEMVVKNAIGKLDLPLDVQSFVRRFLPVSQSELLDLSLDHVFALNEIPNRHRDPFDRMLVAQARVEGMSLMTADPRVLLYPVPTIDARQ